MIGFLGALGVFTPCFVAGCFDLRCWTSVKGPPCKDFDGCLCLEPPVSFESVFLEMILEIFVGALEASFKMLDFEVAFEAGFETLDFKVAIEVYSYTATSVPTERLFKKTKKIMEKANRFSNEQFRKKTFIYSNSNLY